MGFSKFRQHLPWSSRDSHGESAQPKENLSQVEPNSPGQTQINERANKVDIAASVGTVQSQGSATQIHRNPKKLQRSPSSQPVNSFPSPSFNDPYMYANYHQGPPFPPTGNPPYMGNTPPQYQPAFSPPPVRSGHMSPPQEYPPPQQYPPPMLVREPPTSVMEEVKRWPKYPMPVPPMPSPFQISQGYIMPPWTPNRPALDAWDTRGSSAVPTYELPPPDLMDYDMSFLIAFRMLPEWTKRMEDRHWEQVRRMRNDYLRAQWGQERESCVIM